MRVLIAIAPAMYRETLAHVLRERRPSITIKAVDPSDLEGEVSFFEPDLLISDTSSGYGSLVMSLVEILYTDNMGAYVRVNEKDSKIIDDIELEELLAIVDETQELISRRSSSSS